MGFNLSSLVGGWMCIIGGRRGNDVVVFDGVTLDFVPISI